jgi:branched-chain amino acid transport system substrate-binding protein
MMHASKRLKQLSMVVAVTAALGLATAHGDEIVNIGYTGPLSGGAAQYGKNVLSGIEMGADEVNAAGGVRIKGKIYKFKVVALDDQYNPAQSAINGRRLVEQDKTPVIFCPHSGGIFALQTFNTQANFLLMAYSSVPRITETGNKLTVRIPPSFASYVPAFTHVEMKLFGKAVGLAPSDTDYGKAWSKTFREGWEHAGGKVVADNPMSYNKSADFYSGVSRVLAAKPDVMFVGGPSEPTALVVKQARELGFKGGFVVMDQAKFDEMAKFLDGYSMLNGSIGVLPLVADTRPAMQAYIVRYAKNHDGRNPTSEALYNYTMVHAMAAAMNMAGTTTDVTAIRNQMASAIKSLPASQNPQVFTGLDANGGTESDAPLALIENGKIKQVRSSELMK